MTRSQLSFYDDDRDRSDRDTKGGSERPPVWTVGQIVRGAHRLLEGRFANVWVEGEVSGLKVGGNGHAYFTLVDDDAALPAAMWRSGLERLRFALADGQRLRVLGRLGVFAKQGRMQFYVDRAEPAGLGAMMLELEQRKQRLAAEGLLDPARKRALPRWPRAIGVVTSAHGAAIHDILEVTRGRCPCRVVLAPAVVQGPEAPRSLVRALTRLCKQPEIDVVIIGRGGGSVEDLWAFNDERLARAIAACPVPVVSAVGHEVDVTICDLVADVRAATPSHAAELVVPDRRAALRRLQTLSDRLAHVQTRRLLDERNRLASAIDRLAQRGRALVAGPRVRLVRAERALAACHPRRRLDADRRRLVAVTRRLESIGRALPKAMRARLVALQLRVATIGRGLPKSMRARLVALQQRVAITGRALPRPARLRLARAAGALHALSPLAVLERGYAVVTDPHGRALVDASTVRNGDTIAIRLAAGRLRAEVIETTADSADD